MDICNMSEPKPKKRLIKKFRHKFRLVLLNDETFEEKISLKLTPLGVFTLMGVLFIISIVITSLVIAFTPLRKFIPGYTDVNLRKNLVQMVFRVDSLEREIMINAKYLNNINLLLSGNPPLGLEESKKDTSQNYKNIAYSKSAQDSALRQFVESEEKFNIFFKPANARKGDISSFVFFTPLKGQITNVFNAEKSHFGVDIVAPENEAIKATLDGTVIFTGWTSETGYVIHLQHTSNIVSIYKHNSVLLKKTGDYVKAGNPIAIIGNSGEYTSGAHLHFELWYNGLPINPETYMMFSK
ncbi:Murein hydrolase activator NlpD [Flavobacteriales bacterium]|nr:hypothetical protein [Flavobacteriales bacterium]GIK70888.1 MAG: peptidase M23 [Bacteroidota bacterium]CAG0963563.1 Murein hydrolase activator NlpD [Flavobacteriales bacterium]